MSLRWKLVQQGSLSMAAFLFFGTATIGFKWVHSPYLQGYVLAALGFLCLSQLAATLAPSNTDRRQPVGVAR